jgi:hypothetical protein
MSFETRRDDHKGSKDTFGGLGSIMEIFLPIKKQDKHQKDLVELQKELAREPGSPLTWEPPEDTEDGKRVHDERMQKLSEKFSSWGVNVPQSHLAMQLKVNEEIKAKVPRMDSTEHQSTNGTNQSSEDSLQRRMEQIGQESAVFQAKLKKEESQRNTGNIMKGGNDMINRSHSMPDGSDNDKKGEWQLDSYEKLSKESKDDLNVRGLLKEGERQQLEDAIHRTESLNREDIKNKEILDIADRMRELLKDTNNKDQTIRQDLLISDQEKLREKLQNMKQEEIRENLEERRKETEKQSRIDAEQQRKPRSVGAQMGQKEAHPDQSSKGNKGNKA